MLATLRQRNFALLWFGGLVSMIGNWVIITALPFYIYEQTGSALASSATFMAYTLPSLLLSSVAGVFVDRWDRKRILVSGNLAQAVLILLLLLLRSNEWLWLAYAVAFLETTIALFTGPSENALLPRLVGQERLITANSLNTVNDNIARLAGPSIGGALMAIFGLSSVVLLDSLTFLFAAAMISLISVGPETTQDRPGEDESAEPVRGRWAAFWREWLQGLRTIRGNRVMIVLFVVAAIGGLGDNILTALFVPFVDEILSAGALGFGSILTARGVGGLIGGLVVGQFAATLSPSRLLAFGLSAVGLILLVMFNFPSHSLALPLVGLVGVAYVAQAAGLTTLLQSGVSDRYRGRVLGAYSTTAALFGLVGLGLGGTLGDVIGIIPMLNLSGALWVLAGLVGLLIGTAQPRQPTLATSENTSSAPRA